MPKLNKKAHSFITNDWIVALGLLCIFLLTNSYIYGWDDQHLEIPFLKKLIDPSLYPGDYYVDALQNNFPSFLYPLLAKCITVSQVPAAYFFLYLLSRYFFHFWMYKLWHVISGRRFTAFFCVLMITLLGRVEEFLYRTFSHQEFALAIIMAGIYFFYKNRFVLASLILGISVNFHALYSLFPFLYLLGYLVWQRKHYSYKLILKSGLTFSLAAMPFLIWMLQRFFTKGGEDSIPYESWHSLYMLACPQNFIFYKSTPKEVFSHFNTFVNLTHSYWTAVTFFCLNFFYNDTFQKDKKVKAVLGTAAGLLGVSYVFTYIWPIRLIIDMNLIRNYQYILFFLMGYTIVLTVQHLERRKWLTVLVLFMTLPLIRFGKYVLTLTAVVMVCALSLERWLSKPKDRKRTTLLIALISLLLLSLAGIIYHFIEHRYSQHAIISLWATLALVLIGYGLHFFIHQPGKDKKLRLGLFVLIFVSSFADYGYYFYRRTQIERKGLGFWQMQRNWIDMQNFVRENVPKDEVLLVPYDLEMGGFRSFSERSILVSYRDCGIVGFNYSAAEEWKRRIEDIFSFKAQAGPGIMTAVANAVEKYDVSYIVFMNYMKAGNSSYFESLYENEVFQLIKIKTSK